MFSIRLAQRRADFLRGNARWEICMQEQMKQLKKGGEYVKIFSILQEAVQAAATEKRSLFFCHGRLTRVWKDKSDVDADGYWEYQNRMERIG